MPAWGVHFSGVCISLPSFLPLGLLRPRETKETLIAFLGVCIVSAPFYGTAAASSQRGGGWGHLHETSLLCPLWLCSRDCITSLLQSWLSPMSCVVASEEAEPCPLLLQSA